jgi:hypothetical protein
VIARVYAIQRKPFFYIFTAHLRNSGGGATFAPRIDEACVMNIMEQLIQIQKRRRNDGRDKETFGIEGRSGPAIQRKSSDNAKKENLENFIERS